SSLQGKDVEMELSAVDLINKAPRSAKQVAEVAYEGMKVGKFLIMTDAEGRIAYHSKRFNRRAYSAAMKRTGATLAEGRPLMPAFVEKFQARAARRSK
ncbi:MAG: short-chain dehydrogenase, partial [Actinomycetota bacterium]|nr:short-chain dehydrogenase [Actinomycetota bacterium]